MSAKLVLSVVALLTVVAAAGCGSDEPSTGFEARGASIVEECRGTEG